MEDNYSLKDHVFDVEFLILTHDSEIKKEQHFVFAECEAEALALIKEAVSDRVKFFRACCTPVKKATVTNARGEIVAIKQQKKRAGNLLWLQDSEFKTL